MKFTMIERKVQTSDKLQEYAKKKIGKLDRFFGEEAEAVIRFRTERETQIVEVTVVQNGIVYRAERGTNDMFASVDAVEDLLERQIRKNKTRLEKKLREGAFEREIVLSVGEPEDDYDVVRRKKFTVKPMTVDEAILQMNMLNHQFFVFRNVEEDDTFSVIYHRAAGGYGLIAGE